MKRVNLISLLTVLISMVVNNVLAYDIEMPNNDGVTIYYVFNEDRTELIVSKNENVKYQGDIVIPSSVTFEGITYPVTGIEDVFNDCTELTSVIIPKSLIHIETLVFQKCINLASIQVEEGNSVYDSRENCNAIIESATNTLIAGCKNTIIPNGITAIHNLAFMECLGLTSIKIPNSVINIDLGAFWACKNLVSVELGNNIEVIAPMAFNSTKISSIILPHSIKQIEFWAFTSCRELADVYCYAQEMPNIDLDINFSAFDCSDWIISASKYPTLHVPEELIELYKEDAQWGKFRDIVPLTDDDPKPTGIISVNSNKNSIDNSVYNLQGHKLSQPQKGLNIIRTNDGKTKKVVVK